MNKGTNRPESRSRQLMRRVVKCGAVAVVSVLTLFVLTMSAMVWILTPERLTPLIVRVANDNLNGTMTLGKAELTFWHTFPKLYVELDSMTLSSNAFSCLSAEQRASLPADADTLLRVGRFRGGVNVLSLLTGKISLHDIELGGARLNAVTFDSTLTNFDIVPPSTEPKSDEATSLPDIRINRFEIIDEFPIRYLSVADTLDLEMTLIRSELLATGKPTYRLTMNSSLEALLPADIKPGSMPISIGGNIEWLYETPTRFRFSDFMIGLGPVDVKLDAILAMTSPSMTIEALSMGVDNVSVMDAMTLVPEQWCSLLSQLTTDMKVSATAKMTGQYRLDAPGLPNFEVGMTVPECGAIYGGFVVDAMSLTASALIDGSDLDKSVVTIKALSIEAPGVDVNLHGSASSPLTDPLLDGYICAKVNFNQLPQSILAMVPGTISGFIDIDTDAKFHLSDLSINGFHRMVMTGDLDMERLNVAVPDMGVELFARQVCLKFGANASGNGHVQRVDSLLTASLTIDTLSANYEGMAVSLNALNGSFGCVNMAITADTTLVRPFGGKIRVGRLHYRDIDKMIVNASTLSAEASLRRFAGDCRRPQVKVGASIKSLAYADTLNRLALSRTYLNATAHLRPIKPLSPSLQRAIDSLAHLHPALPTDSLRRLARRTLNGSQRRELDGSDVIDFGVDGPTKRLLRKWNVSGSLLSARGNMFTPYFPLVNQLSHVDVRFTTDSVCVNNVRYHAGNSDFLVNGAIRNLRRAVTSGKPINIDLTINSDTIDVNELLKASYEGAAFSSRLANGSVKLAGGETQQQLLDMTGQPNVDGASTALLVPVNVEANIAMRANTLLYSDMTLKDLTGQLLMSEGSLNLHNIIARSGIGNARFTALYSAPRRDEIKLGFGLRLDDIRIKEFVGLMPAIDSLMPLLSSFKGRISADMAATVDIDSMMNIKMPTLNAAMRLEGSDLVLLDAETFRTLSKWLMFRDKKNNVIPHMDVEMLIADNKVELYPFVFDMDRYRLAVMGSNDLDMNFKYHVSVLKSPIPFKFGINLSGNADKMKVRPGRARYKSSRSKETLAIVDTTRINLLKEIEQVFNRTNSKKHLSPLQPMQRPEPFDLNEESDTLSHEDSVMFIEAGLLPAPPPPAPATPTQTTTSLKKTKKKK